MDISEVVVKLKPELDKVAGQAAGKSLEDVLTDAFSKSGSKFLGDMSKGFGGLGEEFGGAIFGEAAMSAALGPIGMAVGALTAMVDAAVMAGTAIYQVGKFSINSAIEVAHLGREFEWSSEKAEITAEQFQLMAQAALETGIPIHQLTLAMKMMNKAIYAAMTKPNGEAAISFKAMGVAVTDANGKMRQTEAVLGDLQDQFKAMPMGPSRAALATKMFGIRGHELIPFLVKGKQYVSDLKDKMEEYGELMHHDLIQDSLKFTQATNDLNAAWLGFKNRLADLGVLDALTWIIEKATRVVVWFSKGLKQMTEYTEEGHDAALLLESVMSPLIGIVMGFGFAIYHYAIPALQMLLPMVQMIATPFIMAGLVIDDFIAYMNGAPSVIGDFLKGMEKFGTVGSMFRELFVLIDRLGNSAPMWQAAWQAARLFFDPFLDMITLAGKAFSALGMTDIGKNLQGIGSAGNYADATKIQGVVSAMTAPSSLSAPNNFASAYTAPAQQPSWAPGGGTSHNKFEVTVNASTTATAEEIATHVTTALERHASDAQEQIRQ